MSPYVQADRPLTMTTPLGSNALLPTAFSGREAISQLFHFRVSALAENQTTIEFHRLLGQKLTIHLRLPEGGQRNLSGICKSVRQGGRDRRFTSYGIEIVPELWLLTKKVQSRIFQQLSVPDILKKALQGLAVSFQIQGDFEPRRYCVQYRETDFAFISRLMEEEGIYYFFTHDPDGHVLVLGNTPQSHPATPEAGSLVYAETAGGLQEEDRILSWEKVQELSSGRCTLWDHSFELPRKNLASENTILESVQIGTATHRLHLSGSDNLEIYQYPGAYAKRFDGVDPRGGDKPADLQRVFQDGVRTAGIRMQQEESSAVIIEGTSACRKLASGHRFELEGHFDADGRYVTASVEHEAEFPGGFQSGMNEFSYRNRFTCFPASLPFRPPQTTPKPFIRGTQTGIVVGPGGEDIFTDKYGRVKVQFHWDRDGASNSDSSCWIRVGTPLAGGLWGMLHIPRIGQEVVVSFEEGDPDQPIVIGSVYNAELMPPYKLPAEKTRTGVRSSSSPGGAGFNELRFEDKKGAEQVFLHGERDLDVDINNNAGIRIGKDRTLTVVGKSDHSAKECSLKADTVLIQADSRLTLKVGASEITLDAAGIRVRTSTNIGIEGSALVEIKGALVKVN